MGFVLKIIQWLLGAFLGKSAQAVSLEQAQAAGSAQEAVKVADAAVKTQAAVAQAEADAPRTQAGVVDILNKGEF